MRLLVSALGLLLYGCSATAANTPKLSMNAVTGAHVAPNGRFVAVVDETAEGTSVHVLSCCSAGALLFSVEPKTLSRYMEDPRIDSVAWSADSLLLKIGFSDRGEDFGVVVVDPKAGLGSLRQISAGDAPAAWGAWSTSGHRLYVVPSTDAGGGIYVVDPIAGTSRQLVKGYKAALDLSVSDKVLVTKVEKTAGDVIGYVLVSVDLETGAVTELRP